MDCVGFKSLTFIFFRRFHQGAGAADIDYYGSYYDGKTPKSDMYVGVSRKETRHCLENNPTASYEKKKGFYKRGKIFDFPVSEIVLFVRGFIRKFYGNPCYGGRDKIERGMKRLGQDTQAARGETDRHFKDDQTRGGRDRKQRHIVFMFTVRKFRHKKRNIRMYIRRIYTSPNFRLATLILFIFLLILLNYYSIIIKK